MPKPTLEKDKLLRALRPVRTLPGFPSDEESISVIADVVGKHVNAGTAYGVTYTPESHLRECVKRAIERMRHWTTAEFVAIMDDLIAPYPEA